MRDFAQGSRATQETNTSPVGRALPSRTHFWRSYDDRSLQSAAPPALEASDVRLGLQTEAEEREDTTPNYAQADFGHDFSRISIYPEANPEKQRSPEENPLDVSVQRQADSDKEDEVLTKAKATITRDENISRGENSSKGGHDAHLPPQVQMKMERAFEADFSDVTVHRNSVTAKDLGAIAYTKGNEVHFAPGYNPYLADGQQYLGHELQHVLQQRGDRVAATHRELGYNVNSDVGLETEAADAGKRAASGQKVTQNRSATTSRTGTAVQKKDAPLQLQREEIRGSEYILDISASAEDVLQALIDTASETGQAETVNWRSMFYPVIESQIRGRTLGSISHQFTDDVGLDYDWDVNIKFHMEDVTPTGREQERSVTTTQGGSASPSLGSSRSQTESSGVQVGGQAKLGSPEQGNVSGQVSLGTQSMRGQAQGAGGGFTAGGSQTSEETVKRYFAKLFVDIEVSWTAHYSSWDIINPVKWGAHAFSGDTSRLSRQIGMIIFDRPQYGP